ncbi:unnamed protein product [Acanthoscelides obtectus]|uniref:Uncharacterized protein n=1 Tax=Acanthoscelides obtectus TaxID=200917 RepID=A0A9P0LBV2_ACAOB|nr:unnamed protein product [Acanthoscelides obtectus]CAK1631983.1 hypothetical protein AOBTE_LOCUS7277 [Acanthoscelides obtectus]
MAKGRSTLCFMTTVVPRPTPSLTTGLAPFDYLYLLCSLTSYLVCHFGTRLLDYLKIFAKLVDMKFIVIT